MNKSLPIFISAFILMCHFIALIIRTYVDKRTLHLYVEKKEGHEEYEYYQALKEEHGLSDNYANWDWRVRYCDIIEYDEGTGYMLVAVPDTSRRDPSCRIYSIAQSDANVASASAYHEYTDFDYIDCIESDINVDKNEALNVFHKFLKSQTEVDS